VRVLFSLTVSKNPVCGGRLERTEGDKNISLLDNHVNKKKAMIPLTQQGAAARPTNRSL
jgi:hypothetical protein